VPTGVVGGARGGGGGPVDGLHRATRAQPVSVDAVGGAKIGPLRAAAAAAHRAQPVAVHAVGGVKPLAPQAGGRAAPVAIYAEGGARAAQRVPAAAQRVHVGALRGAEADDRPVATLGAQRGVADEGQGPGHLELGANPAGGQGGGRACRGQPGAPCVKTILQHNTTAQYYSTIRQHNTTGQYYETILQDKTTGQYYGTILQDNTTGQ